MVEGKEKVRHLLFLSCTTMFDIPELTLETLELCDIPEIAALSMVDSGLAGLCEKHMRGRVNRLMLVLLENDGE